MKRYQGKVLTNCRYLSGSASDAEDLTQEVFVKAYFGLAGFEGRSSFETLAPADQVQPLHQFRPEENDSRRWMWSLTSRSRRRARPPGPSVSSSGPTPEGGWVGRFWRSTRPSGIPLVLRDMDGMAYDEIADQLGIGLSAVKMRIKRGREEFRRVFEAQAEGEAAGVGT